MPLYRWTSTSSSGTRHAPSPEALEVMLYEEGVTVISLKRIWFESRVRLSLNQRINLFQELAMMLSAGIDLLGALNLLMTNNSHQSTRLILKTLYESVSSGKSLSESFKAFPDIFSTVITELIRVGETTGDLSAALNHIVDQLKQSLENRQQITKALAYPAILCLSAFGVVAILLGFVMPTLAEVYQDMNAPLPSMTRILMNISQIVATHSLLLSLMIAMFICLNLYMFKRFKSCRVFLSRLILRMPIIKSITMPLLLGSQCQTLSQLLKSGITLTNALSLLQSTSSNEALKQLWITLQTQLDRGVPFSDIIKSQSLLPSMAKQLFITGFETGALDEMTQRLATSYKQQANTRLSQLHTLLEPIIMLILSLVIGSILVALYLPMFQLGSVL
jgi:protein transport protein HofC